MREFAAAVLLVALLLILAACGGTEHTRLVGAHVVAVPKPCRITSTRAACEAYLAKRFGPNTGRIVAVPAGPNVRVPLGICARVFPYPALCKTH